MIVKHTHPALHKVATDSIVPIPDASLCAALIRCMIRCLGEHDNGVGLAAPQVGTSTRIILVKPRPRKPAIVMVNPVITRFSERKSTAKEGCLSRPGFTADIERSNFVEVEWSDEAGNEHSDRFTGFTARIIQHEIDHLNGINIWDARKKAA